MTHEEFNSFCQSLPATSYVMQWGNSHVWKVGGKVFAIAGWSEDDFPAMTFKTSEMAFDLLKEQDGCRPAPYLASRGMKWIQNYAKPGLSDRDLQAYLKESHKLVSLGLTKKLQKELGLNQL
ncbi:MAG: MmcQ/YjbR family DNA-binding protein [bacterium]